MTQILTFAQQITVFWDKEAAGAVYTLTLNGREVYRGTRTHATVDGLTPDTAYAVTLTCGEQTRYCATVHTRALGRVIDVRDYGAVGDGAHMDTAALQAAIDACGVGETVYLSAGTYLSGALFLHSDMELYLAKGAILLGSEDPEAYLPKVPSRFEGVERMCYASLLNIGVCDRTAGYTTARVSIRGEGCIRGGGRPLAERTVKRDSPDMPDFCTDEDGHLIVTNQTVRYMCNRTRGRLIQIANAEDITIAGVGLENGPAWNVHFIYSRRVVTYGCVFRSENVWNGDGWDPDSSEDCTIFDCTFHTGDDSVAVKSGKNPEGNEVDRPTRGIRIFDCTCASGHGLTVGSEMSGGVEGVYIWDCNARHSLYGVEIKGTWKRGGYIRDIRVTDTVMPRFLMHAVPYNNDGDPAAHMPRFSDCSLERVTLTGKAYAPDTKVDRDISGKSFPVDPIEIVGFTEEGCDVTNVRLSDITLERREDGMPLSLHLDLISGICLEGIRTVPAPTED